MKHHIKRTNPKGQPLTGICILCGKENLSVSAVLEDCPNYRGLTTEQAMIEAIEGPATAMYPNLAR